MVYVLWETMMPLGSMMMPRDSLIHIYKNEDDAIQEKNRLLLNAEYDERNKWISLHYYITKVPLE